MAQSNAEKLVNLGMPAELAKQLEAMIAGGNPYTDAKARDAIKTKTEIATLDGDSTAADIVAALKA